MTKGENPMLFGVIVLFAVAAYKLSGGRNVPTVLYPSAAESENSAFATSGISNPDTVKALRQAGFRGFLIGENFMKTADPGQALNEFIQSIVK